jgi:Xaa-Pro aminopeptidase
MLTPRGCRDRVERLRKAVDTPCDAVLVTLPEHLLYLSNYFPNPCSLNLQSYAFLLVEREGPTTLFIDNWPADGVGQDPVGATVAADRVDVTEWYTCARPARLRGGAVAAKVAETLRSLRIETLAAETAHLPWAIASAVRGIVDCEPTLRRLREIKDADELDAIRVGVRTAEAVHAASRELLRPGISELEYYAALHARAVVAAGTPFVMMCDLASGSRAAQGGGNPTSKRIERGELVILDFFPYVAGYRGDITNTLVCGGSPTAADRELFDVVASALSAGERRLQPGAPVREIHRAVDDRIRTFGKDAKLAHHAGHAIGLGHPEAPEFVPDSDRELAAGMVVTLEPGLYGRPNGGLRLEHDYLITTTGFERLSQHRLGLD